MKRGQREGPKLTYIQQWCRQYLPQGGGEAAATGLLGVSPHQISAPNDGKGHRQLVKLSQGGAAVLKEPTRAKARPPPHELYQGRWQSHVDANPPPPRCCDRLKAEGTQTSLARARTLPTLSSPAWSLCPVGKGPNSGRLAAESRQPGLRPATDLGPEAALSFFPVCRVGSPQLPSLGFRERGEAPRKRAPATVRGQCAR